MSNAYQQMKIEGDTRCHFELENPTGQGSYYTANWLGYNKATLTFSAYGAIAKSYME